MKIRETFFELYFEDCRNCGFQLFVNPRLVDTGNVVLALYSSLS